MTYADTSALVKLLVAEPETSALRAALAAFTGSLSSSELTIAELTRTAARAGVPPPASHRLLSQLDLLALDRSLLGRAGRLPSAPGTFLRTADAIHLAAAMSLGEAQVLTYDRRQAQCAAQHGFTVWSPGRDEDWYR